MLLMMGGTVLMVFLMPKIMSGIDPEALKEATERSQATQPTLEMPDISQGLANWFAPPPPPSSASSSSQKAGSSSSKSSKKK
jgi:ER membrane protein complex subunit 7